LEEYGHSDRNGGILLKNRKNSAKIIMVGSNENAAPKMVLTIEKPHISPKQALWSVFPLSCARAQVVRWAHASKLGAHKIFF